MSLPDRLAARALELVDVPSESRNERDLAALVLDVLRDAGARERQLEHHRERALHVAGPEPMDAAVADPPGPVVLRRDGVEVPGQQQRRLGRAGEQAGVAEVAHRHARLSQHGGDMRGEPLLVARLRRDVDELERPRGQPLAELRVTDHAAPR